ncbi:MAG TPA: phosphopantetheine-binding protein [Granulicella sp.]|nr:phosphopantetheine-binding protein [Granulicella sp.]
MDIERRCIEIIAKSKLLPAEAVTRDKTFDELGIDSLDKINISFEVEEIFSITIPDDALGSLRTVGDVVDGVVRLRQSTSIESAAPTR